MDKFQEEFRKGKIRKANPIWRQYEGKIQRLKRKSKEIWNELTQNEREIILKQIRELEKQRREHPYSEPMDTSYKRIQYVRYADDLLIGVIGSKEDALKVKEELTNFLIRNLNLELSQEKTLVTHNSQNAKFLGYEISIRSDNSFKKDKNGSKNRVYNNKPELYMPNNAWVNKLLQLGALKIHENGKWESQHRTTLLHLDDLEIITTYNAEIRGLYNYYQLASNVHKLTNFKYFMEYSMYKTYANKYKLSVAKVKGKYRRNKDFAIRYETPKGVTYRHFYNEGFKRNTKGIKDIKLDEKFNPLTLWSRGSLIDRLTSNQCEYCGAQDIQVEMHHVRKLKDLKGKKKWEVIMIARKRKTLALCKKCHKDLHNGKLD